jgi:cell division protein FtsB
MSAKKIFSSKFVLAIIILFLLFVTDLKYKQWRNQQAIDRQRQDIVDQINLYTQKNNDLNQSMSYLNSTSFKEKVAREQLNLKKDGELAYTFTQSAATTTQAVAAVDNRSNFEKWVDYFTN